MNATSKAAYVVGVDVGTGSARAGVFDERGGLLGRAVHAVDIHRPQDDFVEQDSENIWSAVCASVRDALAEADIAVDAVAGLAFDAACSLVLRDQAGAPISVTPNGDTKWDTIVWMDHRAVAEARQATATGTAPLAFIGGTMSPEMQTPKLAWIKRNFPERWGRLEYAFDLSDFLAWKATGSAARSACTLTCKWTYLADAEPHWDPGYLEAMGLSDLQTRASLPDEAAPVGSAIGRLTQAAAADLGLTPACVVGAGLIDAHAGAVGTLAPFLDAGIDRHIALIGGTSNCHMALSQRSISIDGVWGPYKDAVVPGLYLSEGGQSAAGALLDHILASSSATARLGETPHDAIAEILISRMEEAANLAPDLHVLPDFHGNRSPLADPQAVGAITGLSLGDPFEALLSTYWAAAAAIAYETREIIEAMNANGYRIETAHLSGGAIHNPVLVKLYSEAAGVGATLPESPDPVLLGAAVAAAAAGGLYPGLTEAAKAMVRAPKPVAQDNAAVAVHNRRYEHYKAFADFQRRFHKAVREHSSG